MAFGMPGGTTHSESTQPGNSMAGMQMAGSALSALPALIGSGSDRRLKENIKKFKQLLDGLWVYTYNYIGQVGRTIGLMADEVEEVYPDAVGVDSNGFKYVRYLMVLGWVMELKGAM
jgi:Chaperone of endosialidase